MLISVYQRATAGHGATTESPTCAKKGWVTHR